MTGGGILRGRAGLVARRVGEAIRLGLLLDGERLPPEPRLAEQLGVAPVTLREALAMLREQALVSTRRGRRGGTFVHAPADLGEPLRRFSVHELRDLGEQLERLRAAGFGVAAADVLVASLEQRVRPALVALDRPTALTNGEGRIIASNDPDLAPGLRVDAEGPGWLLVETSVS